MRDLERVRRAVMTEPWAIMPEKLEAIIGVLEASTEGDFAAAAKGMSNPKAALEEVAGLPVVPIRGVIAKRMNLFHAISGGTSIELIEKMFDEAMATDAPAVILSIDSPGGAVSGVPEFAAKVKEAADTSEKVIVAWADGLAASAAYWIGSQANDFFASSAAVVGSIGVIATIYDDTRRMRNEGVDETIIRSSELKAAGAGTLTPSQKDAIVNKVRTYYGMFKDAVAEARPDIDIEIASNGDTWIGQQAVALGLVDGVRTLSQVAARYVATVENA